VTRHLWNALGGASLVLGVAGIPLPLLPTTPFLLLSAFAFARGSPRLHAWLVHHPRFGPTIEAWERERAISRSTKWKATVALAAVLLPSAFLDVPAWVRVVHVSVVVAICAFVWTRREPRSTRA
jgi:hypothetical protein